MTEQQPSPAAEPDTLAAALARHQLELPAEIAARVEQYAQLLWEWNAKMNLTRHTDYEQFVTRDLVDTLQLARLIHDGEEVLDVGSGGGVPGLLLAILRPQVTVHLCDSIGKKAAALGDMCERLGLEVPVFPTRAEEQLGEARYDVVTCRAVGPLDRILAWFSPYARSIGRLLLIKGPKWPEEKLEAARRGLLRKWELKIAAEYPLANTTAQSFILKCWPHGRREPG